MASTETLFDWISRIYRAVEIDKIKAELVEGCRVLFGFDHVMWFELEQGRPVLSQCKGAPELAERPEVRECLLDMASQPKSRREEYLTVRLDGQECGLLVCPIQTRNRLSGVFIGAPGPDSPALDREEGRALFRDFLNQAANAIDNQMFVNEILNQVVEAHQVKDLAENIIESMADGLLAVDMHGRILRMNRAMESNFHASRTRALGQVLWEVWPEPEGIDWRTLIERKMAPGQLVRIHGLGAPTVEGSGRVQFNAAVIPMFNRNELRVGSILVMEFLTEKFELMKALEQSSRLAAIGQFASGIAHQLRNPLGIIRVSADHMSGRAEGDERIMSNCAVLKRQVLRAERIITSLMDFARERKEDRVLVSLRETVVKLLKLRAETIREQGVEVVFEPPGDVAVVAGVMEIQEILGNIIDNAIQAMPEGGRLTVELERFAKAQLEMEPELYEESYAAVTVRDTGPGIAREIRDRVFEPFFSARDDGSLGLGLSSAYGLARSLRGTIRVLDARAGAAVRVHIPAHRPEPGGFMEVEQ